MSICVFFYDKVEVTRTIRMRSLEISCDKISWQVTQYFVTVKKYRLVRTGNGQLSTRTRVILLWATPVGLRSSGLRPVLDY